MQTPRRLPGLDLLRCFAIFPVIAYHTPLVSPHLERLGFLGVEIFFALSGFLILQMIVERFDGVATRRAFGAFMVNRWLRTVPLYLVMLGLYALVTIFYDRINPQGIPVVGAFDRLPDIAPYLFFSQNLLTGGDAWNHGWYGISWSLSVEEWFYVLFPATLLLFRRVPLLRLVLIFSVGMIALMVALRAHRYLGNGPLHFDDMFRRAVFLRLDAFCYGALVYLAMRVAPDWIRAQRLMLFLAGALLIALCYGHAPAPCRYDYFMAVLFLALVPAGFSLMIPAFYHLDIPGPAVQSALTFVSTRTYSLYLWHLLVGLWFTVTIAPITVATLVPLLALNLVVADLSYRLIERPFLRLRPNTAAARPAEVDAPAAPAVALSRAVS